MPAILVSWPRALPARTPKHLLAIVQQHRVWVVRRRWNCVALRQIRDMRHVRCDVSARGAQAIHQLSMATEHTLDHGVAGKTKHPARSLCLHQTLISDRQKKSYELRMQPPRSGGKTRRHWSGAGCSMCRMVQKRAFSTEIPCTTIKDEHTCTFLQTRM